MRGAVSSEGERRRPAGAMLARAAGVEMAGDGGCGQLRNTWIVDYGDSSIPSRRRVIMQAMPGKRSYGTGELHEKHGAYFGATDFGRAPTGPVGRSPDRQTAASRGSRNAGTTRPHSRVSVDEVQSGSAP